MRSLQNLGNRDMVLACAIAEELTSSQYPKVASAASKEWDELAKFAGSAD